MKLYTIRDWDKLYENNRSRTVEALSWVKMPNRHDGENFSAIMNHKEGSKIFAAFVLMVQIASRCSPRGTLIRSNGVPHDPPSLSLKCRAPSSWFEIALPYLEYQTDWLEVVDVPTTDSQVTSGTSVGCQSGAQEGKGKKGMELKGMEERNGASHPLDAARIIFDAWNLLKVVPQCLVMSDKRRRTLVAQLKDPFFRDNWGAALEKIQRSAFLCGKNTRGWKANFDWFIRSDTIAKIMEGKYDDTTNTTNTTRPKYSKWGEPDSNFPVQ